MAVLALFSGPMTLAQYDSLRFTVNWGRDQPAGAMLHAASFDDAGHIHMADVWETAEALQAFWLQRFVPALAALNIVPPDVAVYPIHTLQAFGALDSYRL